MELIKPSFGLIFWMLIGFGILFFILAKFAWPVILKAIRNRETFIEKQITEAERVREDMKNLKSEHVDLMRQAKEERDRILADARKLKEKMIEETKVECEKATQNMIIEAREQIKNEKMKAMFDIKNEGGILCIEISEKILSQELSDKEKQENYIKKCLNDISLN